MHTAELCSAYDYRAHLGGADPDPFDLLGISPGYPVSLL